MCRRAMPTWGSFCGCREPSGERKGPGDVYGCKRVCWLGARGEGTSVLPAVTTWVPCTTQNVHILKRKRRSEAVRPNRSGARAWLRTHTRMHGGRKAGRRTDIGKRVQVTSRANGETMRAFALPGACGALSPKRAAMCACVCACVCACARARVCACVHMHTGHFSSLVGMVTNDAFVVKVSCHHTRQTHTPLRMPAHMSKKE